MALLAAGCAHYAPRPVDPAAFPAAYDARRIEPATLGGHAALLAATLRYSPAVRQSGAAYISARSGVAAARIGPAATLTLLSEYANDATTTSPWLFGIAADIPLDAGARRAARLANADRAVLSALYDYGEAIWAARSALRHAEIERGAAAAEASLLVRVVQARAALLDLTDRRVRAGEDAAAEAARARTDLAAAQRRLDAARARQARAEAAIAAAVGAPLTAFSAAPVEPLPDDPPAAVGAAELQGLRRTAVLTRPDVLRAILAYEQSEADLRLEVAKQYPEIHLQPGYTWERGLSKYPFNLALVLPPRDLNRAGIARAEALRSQAGRKLEAAQADVLASADGAAAALALTIAAADQAQLREVAAARRTADLAQQTLAGGEADRLERLTAQIGLVESEITAADARRQAWDARAGLEDALRRPFDPAETAVLANAARSPA